MTIIIFVYVVFFSKYYVWYAFMMTVGAAVWMFIPPVRHIIANRSVPPASDFVWCLIALTGVFMACDRVAGL